MVQLVIPSYSARDNRFQQNFLLQQKGADVTSTKKYGMREKQEMINELIFSRLVDGGFQALFVPALVLT